MISNLETRTCLAETEAALDAFAEYSYRVIPEHAPAMRAELLPRAALCADAIVAAVAALPDPPKQEPAAPVSPSLGPRVKEWMHHPIARMLGYFAIMSAIGALSLGLILHLSDDTIAVSVLPTAAVMAVWLASLSRHVGGSSAPPDSAP
jgi:hypothetical protein